jgi:hypothetical protein
MSTAQLFKDRNFLAVIGDEVTLSRIEFIIGLCYGSPSRRNRAYYSRPKEELPHRRQQYALPLIALTQKRKRAQLKKLLMSLHSARMLPYCLSINMYFIFRGHAKRQVAEKIRYRVDNYTAAFPTVLEIPSKEHPYGMSCAM